MKRYPSNYLQRSFILIVLCFVNSGYYAQLILNLDEGKFVIFVKIFRIVNLKNKIVIASLLMFNVL